MGWNPFLRRILISFSKNYCEIFIWILNLVKVQNMKIWMLLIKIFDWNLLRSIFVTCETFHLALWKIANYNCSWSRLVRMYRKLAPSMFNPLNKIFLKLEIDNFLKEISLLRCLRKTKEPRASFGQQVVGQKSADCLKLERGKCQYFTCPIPKRVKNYWGSRVLFWVCSPFFLIVGGFQSNI